MGVSASPSSPSPQQCVTVSRSSSNLLELFLSAGVIHEGLDRLMAHVTPRLVGRGCLSESPKARAGYRSRRSRSPHGWSQ